MERNQEEALWEDGEVWLSDLLDDLPIVEVS